MVTIPLGYAEGGSQDENVSPIRLRNMYLTENRFSPDKMARLTRPSLTLFKSITSSPVYGIWRQDGTLNDDWLVVCGETLYRVDPISLEVTELGALPGTDYCVFAGTVSRVIVVRNGVAYSTDGTTITTIAMPDGRLVGSVGTIDGSFLLGVKGSQRFYWIKPGETDPDPLSFASAERTPDSLMSINIVSDELWFLGASGVEVWSTTGDQDLPYQRIPGRVYGEGCASAATACVSNHQSVPCLLWVSEKRAVMMAQGTPTRVSTKSVEEKLRSATNLRAWAFRFNQHDFYAVTYDQGTVVYDIVTQSWSTWDSSGEPNWQAHIGFQVNQDVYAGDSLSGTIWKLEDEATDNGEPIVRELSGFIAEQAAGTTCNSVNLRMNTGWTLDYDYTPKIEMRFSDDYGFSWSVYLPANIGNKGNYEYDVVWRSLGRYGRPGREFQFRYSDLSKLRIDYATMNEV